MPSKYSEPSSRPVERERSQAQQHPIEPPATLQPERFDYSLSSYRNAGTENSLSDIDFAQIFRDSPVANVLLDIRQNTILDISRGFEKMSGYSRDDVLLKNDLAFNFWVDPVDRERVMRQVSTHKPVQDMEFSFRTRSGQTRDAILNYRLLSSNGRTLGLAVITENVRLKKPQENFNLDEQRLEALHRISQMSDAPVEEITAFTLEQAVQLTHSRMGYLAFVSADETHLTFHSWSNGVLDANAMQEILKIYPMDGTGLWGESIRQRRTIINNECQPFDRLSYGLPASHPEITRHMSVPIFDGDRIVLLVGVANKTDSYDEADEWQVSLLLSWMWRILQNKQILDALRDNDDRYRAFMAQSTEGIWRIEMEKPTDIHLSEDEQVDAFYQYGFLAECNELFAQIYGQRNAEAMRGMRLQEILPREDPTNVAYLQAYIRTGYRLTDLEMEVTMPDGKYRQFRNNFFGVVRDSALAMTWGTMRDVTERRRGEKIQSVIYKISHAAGSVEKLQEFFESVHKVLGDLMPVDNFFVALPQSDGQTIHFPYFVDQYDQAPTSENANRGLTGYVLRTGAPLLATPEVFRDLVAQGEVDDVGTPSIDWLGVPLIAKNKIIGVLCVQSYTEGVRFGEEEKSILQFVSTQIAMTIERKRAEETLRLGEARYRAIVEDQTEMICRWLPDGRLTFVNEAYCRYTGKTRSELINSRFMPDMTEQDRERLMKLIANANRDHPLVPYELRTEMPSGETHWVQWVDRALFDGNGKFVEFQSVGQDVTERKQREFELETISTVSASLRVASNPAEMLPIILDQLINLLHIDGAAFAMIDPTRKDIRFELGRGVWEHVQGERFEFGSGISGMVIQTGKPFVSNDIQHDPQMTNSNHLGDLTAGVCVPLISHKQTLGILWAGKRGWINDHEAHLLMAIADIASNAIYRATLFEQTELRLQRLTALRAIDMTISASMDVHVTLDILLNQITTQLGMHAADVLLLNPGTQQLEYASGRGFKSPVYQNTRLRMGESYAGQAALSRQIVYLTDFTMLDDSFIQNKALVNEGFVSYAAVPLVAKGQVRGVLELFQRSPLVFDAEWRDFLQSLGASAAIALDNATLLQELQHSNDELSLAYDATIEGWSRALELRDQETEGHTQRVTELTVHLAQHMGFDVDSLVHIRRGALLHDIGKMAIPDAILLKTGPLTGAEWDVMRKHPEYAYQLLSPIPYLRPALDIPYCHHERWDGTGYPRGLSGENIPLSARIFSVIDVWDALRSDRPYRPAWAEEKVWEYIRSHIRMRFDPTVVEAFIAMMNGPD
ncbi:MAG: GAF domain-containing protein [Anaerolineaceae bacterium]